MQSGLIGHFGALDQTDGGKTSRYSLSYNLERRLKNGSFKFNAYAIELRLNLFSEFTYFLDKLAWEFCLIEINSTADQLLHVSDACAVERETKHKRA